MKIGKTNTLRAIRSTDNGYYLSDEDVNEVLLPNAYVPKDFTIGDTLDVFVYKDSEDRFVATTLKPHFEINEFAYLQVKDVNSFGAFIDWGLPKDLLVPFSEQTRKMQPGEWYLMYLIKDEKTERLVGSTRINDVTEKVVSDLKVGDEINLLLYRTTDLGMNAIVNNKYRGLIFNSNIHKSIQLGDKILGYVQKIREDGKIDILLDPPGYKQSIDKNCEKILSILKKHNGTLELTDKSDPIEIKHILGLSKKAFKRSVGSLYKQKLIILSEDGISLNKTE